MRTHAFFLFISRSFTGTRCQRFKHFKWCDCCVRCNTNATLWCYSIRQQRVFLNPLLVDCPTCFWRAPIAHSTVVRGSLLMSCSVGMKYMHCTRADYFLPHCLFFTFDFLPLLFVTHAFSLASFVRALLLAQFLSCLSLFFFVGVCQWTRAHRRSLAR